MALRTRTRSTVTRAGAGNPDANGSPPRSQPGARQRTRESRWRPLLRAISWHRRLVAAACVAVAVTAGVQVFRPDPPPQVRVVVAAAALPGGRVLATSDLSTVDIEPDGAPEKALTNPTELVGRRLAAPVGAGEPITAVRLLGRSLVGDFGRELGGSAVLTPVRVADAGVLVLVHPGDRVDVIAVGQADPSAAGEPGGQALPGSAGPGAARVVVADAPVLAVQPTNTASGAGPLSDSGGSDAPAGTGLIVLATTGQAALDLAGAAVGSTVSVVVHPAT